MIVSFFILPTIAIVGVYMRRPWEGRVSPSRFFLGNISVAVVYFIIALVLLIATGANNPNAIVPRSIAIIPFILYFPALFYIGCLIIRRCHDLGWSGWFSLIAAIPFVGWIFIIVLLFRSGNPDANKYGPPPGGRTFLAEVFNY